MAGNTNAFGAPGDEFDDDAIRAELLKLVRDAEGDVVAEMEDAKARVRSFSGSSETDPEKLADLLTRLDSKQREVARLYVKMREFI